MSLPDYEIFAYLMIGVAVLAASDLIFGTTILFKPKWNASSTAITVVAAYVIGQMTGLGATIVLEDGVTLSGLGRPVDFLVPNARTPSPDCMACLLAPSFYFEKLHKNTLEQIAKKNEAKKLASEQLFWEAYNTVKQNENAFDRITTFSRLYHFCRNMAFASLLAAVVVVGVRIWRRSTGTPPPLLAITGFPGWLTKPRWQLVAFVLVGVTLYARYLYYFRAHSIEVLTTYAYLSNP